TAPPCRLPSAAWAPAGHGGWEASPVTVVDVVWLWVAATAPTGRSSFTTRATTSNPSTASTIDRGRSLFTFKGDAMVTGSVACSTGSADALGSEGRLAGMLKGPGDGFSVTSAASTPRLAG